MSLSSVKENERNDEEVELPDGVLSTYDFLDLLLVLVTFGSKMIIEIYRSGLIREYIYLQLQTRTRQMFCPYDLVVFRLRFFVVFAVVVVVVVGLDSSVFLKWSAYSQFVLTR